MKAIMKTETLKLSLIILMIIGFSSCKKDMTDPVVNLQMEIEPSSNFEYVEVAFHQLFLYGSAENNDTFKSNLQSKIDHQISGVSLRQGQNLNITTQKHFEMQVVALKPDFDLYLHLNNQGTSQKVFNGVNNYKILLDNPVNLEANKQYDIKLIINPETAIKIAPNNRLEIDWSKVKASISEK